MCGPDPAVIAPVIRLFQTSMTCEGCQDRIRCLLFHDLGRLRTGIVAVCPKCQWDVQREIPALPRPGEPIGGV